jgi:hypothetical protein
MTSEICRFTKHTFGKISTSNKSGNMYLCFIWIFLSLLCLKAGWLIGRKKTAVNILFMEMKQTLHF